MEESTALSVFKNLPFSKIEQTTFVEKVVSEILSGDTSPVEIDLHLKAMEEAITAIRKNEQVKSYTIEEAEKFGKKFETHGVTIEVSQKVTKDFTGIDPVLDDLYTQMENLKAQIKTREATVATGVDAGTGEVFKPFKTTASRFLKYTFK